jgi:hypothetical protein
MSADIAVEGNGIEQMLMKRKLANVEECSSKRKASWGILTSQG